MDIMNMFFTGDGVRLRYNQTGPRNGQQLLFVTGWRQAAVEWRKQVECFSSVGFRVTTFDMRCHGESDEPGFGYRVSRFAADLNDVLTQLDARDVTVIGHSMAVTWAWWDQYPDARKRVAILVLVDQTADIFRDSSWTDAQAALISAIFTPTQSMTCMFTSSVSESNFEWVLSQNKKTSVVNAAALLLDHSFSGEVSVFPHAGIEWIATQIPGARNYTFTAAEKGSHFVFWENPERFNYVLLDFLKARR
ncbi:Alpha/Beta hydrolase protein [Lasiosphaeria miniovina]|uniref:Alpha/Beta hydrolase protein n=1 Tax=Lasiosphaeria miniovina TaxID=1954250 RepID=A0AA40B6F0_9PEZI|nr:Alpha/Beta hydrolase protein [Lasiosphaeria miniovina]KAK0728473.1 Alpha/Beta hydrolase protein [Lasiosphaeria miniovina]